MTPKELVERFYHELWNHADEAVAGEILAQDLCFRGSLRSQNQGREGCVHYMRSVHAALGDYTCMIDELIIADDRAAARMTFKGRHQGPLFGVEATGREAAWARTAFFRIDGGRITDIWVDGDVDGLKQQ